jgi:hypothetical protein
MTIFGSACFLDLERNPHVVGGDIFHVEKRRQLARQHHIGNPLDERSLVHRVRNAGDVQRPPATGRRTLFPRRAQPNRAGAGLVDLLDLLGGIQDLTAGRKVWTFDVAAQLCTAQVRVVEQFDERRADLRQVVRRNVGRHSNGDPRRAVDEQVRNTRRQHDRFGLRAVVIRPEVHRALLDFRQHFIGDSCQPAFRVAHGGGAVAVERSEIARSVDQRVAQ